MKKELRIISLAVFTTVLFGCALITAPIQTPASAVPPPSPTAQITPAPAVSDGSTAALENNLESIFQNVSPSVVMVQVVENSTGASSSGSTIALGSGFVWDTNGDIVTNNHVVANTKSISVLFPDGTEASASVVGTDPGADLAVIHVSVDPAILKPVTLGDSDAVKVGQLAVVIGYPFGLNSTMTYGIISGVSRLLPVSAPDGSGLSYSVPNVIQTDAPINPGNSGGVLLNDQGQVIGVPSANISTSGSSAGIGFAIPSNIVAMEVPTLISAGSYPHAYLGVSGGTLTSDIAQAMNLNPSTRGVLIVKVQSGSPAEKAGLRGSTKTVDVGGTQTPVGGDVIVAADGKPINGFEDLIGYLFLNKKTGDSVDLTILRDGQTQTITVTFAQLS
jgi:S1-C subfamily serine protease